MKNPVTLFGASGFGLMFFIDPNRGTRRRAPLKIRAVRLPSVAQQKPCVKRVNLRNRAQGVWFETERLFRNETLSDDHLNGNLRAQLSRLTSHPHAVKNTVEDGKTTLSSLILADEELAVDDGIASICGVTEEKN